MQVDEVHTQRNLSRARGPDAEKAALAGAAFMGGGFTESKSGRHFVILLSCRKTMLAGAYLAQPQTLSHEFGRTKSRGNMKKLVTFCLSVSMFGSASAALAGPDEDMRDAALAEAAKLRALGWPKERCFMGIGLFNNLVIDSQGKLVKGDKILAINATSVENAITDDVAKAIGTLPASSLAKFKIERDGAVMELDLTCGNSASYQTTYLQALDFAAKKKWKECVDTLAVDADAVQFLDLRIRCARVSRQASAYPIPLWVSKILRRSISMADVAPANRIGAATSLLKSRMDLEPSIYDGLARSVIAWDSGQTWAKVQPDLGLLRRAAERGIKNKLIDPQSAIIEMPFDFIYGTWTPAFSATRFEGFMTCGTVNAKNRMGGYTGATSFISVVDGAGVEKFTDMDNGTSEYFRPVDTACAPLIRKLKIVSNVNSTNGNAASAQGPQRSMAQELEKLAELHKAGALTDAEYAAAKAKILSGN